MEYDYYLEQKYLQNGRVEARILTSAQAEAMGYEDGYKRTHEDHTLYVDGFDSLKAIHNHVSGLVGCTLVE